MTLVIFACGLYAAIYGAWWIMWTYPPSAGLVHFLIGLGLMLTAYRLAFP